MDCKNNDIVMSEASSVDTDMEVDNVTIDEIKPLIIRKTVNSWSTMSDADKESIALFNVDIVLTPGPECERLYDFVLHYFRYMRDLYESMHDPLCRGILSTSSHKIWNGTHDMRVSCIIEACSCNISTAAKSTDNEGDYIVIWNYDSHKQTSKLKNVYIARSRLDFRNLIMKGIVTTMVLHNITKLAADLIQKWGYIFDSYDRLYTNLSKYF